jgi:hypothetical protein
MKLIKNKYFLGTLSFTFLLIYLIQDPPKIIFKTNNKSELNLKEVKCTR